MNRIKVLVVEDDPALRMVVCDTLEIEGFKTIAAENGIEGLHAFSNEEIDVVVADIMMPRLDGLEMVIRMRQRNRFIPILFLTAKSSVDSVVEGFEAGADDYLRKPFSMKELIVRIKALYARANPTKITSSTIKQPSGNINIGNYSFDPVSQLLYFGDESFKLSVKESEILSLLAQNINKVVSSTDIMLELWGDDGQYIVNSLQVFITRLRQRLKDDPAVRIINARGIGYKLVVDIPL